MQEISQSLHCPYNGQMNTPVHLCGFLAGYWCTGCRGSQYGVIRSIPSRKLSQCSVHSYLFIDWMVAHSSACGGKWVIGWRWNAFSFISIKLKSLLVVNNLFIGTASVLNLGMILHIRLAKPTNLLNFLWFFEDSKLDIVSRCFFSQLLPCDEIWVSSYVIYVCSNFYLYRK